MPRRNTEGWYQIWRWRMEMYGEDIGGVWARTQADACRLARRLFGSGSITATRVRR